MVQTSVDIRSNSSVDPKGSQSLSVKLYKTGKIFKKDIRRNDRRHYLI